MPRPAEPAQPAEDEERGIFGGDRVPVITPQKRKTILLASSFAMVHPRAVSPNLSYQGPAHEVKCAWVVDVQGL